MSSPEEIVYRLGCINRIVLRKMAKPLVKTGSGRYLLRLIDDD